MKAWVIFFALYYCIQLLGVDEIRFRQSIRLPDGSKILMIELSPWDDVLVGDSQGCVHVVRFNGDEFSISDTHKLADHAHSMCFCHETALIAIGMSGKIILKYWGQAGNIETNIPYQTQINNLSIDKRGSFLAWENQYGYLYQKKIGENGCRRFKKGELDPHTKIRVNKDGSVLVFNSARGVEPVLYAYKSPGFIAMSCSAAKLDFSRQRVIPYYCRNQIFMAKLGQNAQVDKSWSLGVKDPVAGCVLHPAKEIIAICDKNHQLTVFQIHDQGSAGPFSPDKPYQAQEQNDCHIPMTFGTGGAELFLKGDNNVIDIYDGFTPVRFSLVKSAKSICSEHVERDAPPEGIVADAGLQI